MNKYSKVSVENILITPDEARKILGVGRNRIYMLVKEEGFPAFRIGERFFINKSLLNEWTVDQCIKK